MIDPFEGLFTRSIQLSKIAMRFLESVTLPRYLPHSPVRFQRSRYGKRQQKNAMQSRTIKSDMYTDP
jgi:hypothetical protein